MLEVRRGEVQAGGGELEAAVVSALKSLRPRPLKVHLVLPPTAHVLATVTLPSLPAKERPQALRWQLAKLCDFSSEETQLAFRPGPSGSVLGLRCRMTQGLRSCSASRILA